MANVIAVTAKGKTYYYFRPSPGLHKFFGRRLIRLPDNRADAEAKVVEIMAATSTEEINRPATKAEVTAARIMLNNATGRAKKRNLVVSLTKHEIIQMLREHGYRCAITQKPFDLDWRTGRDARRNAFAPSLDRIDNKQGYSRENCRLVLSAVNYAMNEWGLDLYLELAEAAFRFRTKRERAAQNETLKR